jgi:SNF2 family DNA or RNA helicase
VIRTELRPYQEEAVAAARPHDGFCLFPEQRTGKCLVSLAIVEERRPDVCIIVCPKKAVLTWDKEIDKHLDNDWGCEFYIVTYQEPVKDLALRKEWYKETTKWQKQGVSIMVIADEAHYIKKPGTAQSRFTRTIAKRAQWKLALTGTPADKGYEQYWAIFDFIGHKEIFGTYESFKEEYVVYTIKERKDGRQYPVLTGYRNEEQLLEIIHHYSYRITFNEARVAMGKSPVRVRRRKVRFKLGRKARAVYNELNEDMETIIDGLTVGAPLPVTLPQKLQQVCGGFLLHQERIPGERKRKRTVIPCGTEKLDKLMELLSGFGQEKAVICCRFTHEIDAIAAQFEAFHWTYKIIDGQNEWDGEFDVDFVILQVRSGLGFDLSEANAYVFYSWDHSWITFDQSRFRIMNMETTNWVYYYFLMAEDTIEDEFYEAVAKKKEFAELVLDRWRKKAAQKRRGSTRRGARRVRKTHLLADAPYR